MSEATKSGSAAMEAVSRLASRAEMGFMPTVTS